MSYIGHQSVYIVPTLGSINVRENTADANQYVLEAGEIAAISVYISRKDLAELIFRDWSADVEAAS